MFNVQSNAFRRVMMKVQINICLPHLERIKYSILVSMTLTLVKIINIEILYDLDWNLTFVEFGDLNIVNRGRLPGPPKVSGDSDDQDIPDQRSQIQVDSDQGDTNINCPLIPSQSHTKHIFMGWEIHLSHWSQYYSQAIGEIFSD